MNKLDSKDLIASTSNGYSPSRICSHTIGTTNRAGIGACRRRNLSYVRALGFGLLTCIAAVSQVKADGFAFSNDVFTTINVPGLNGTVPTAINDLGQIVGSDNNENIGFVYQNGSSILLSPPPNRTIRPVGINDSGTIVGNRAVIPGQGFSVFLYTAGNFTTIPLTFSSSSSEATGINNSGQIVGFNDFLGEGFIYANGSTTLYSHPGSTATNFLGISNNGQILGNYVDSTGHHYFVYDFNSGLVMPLTIPCATYGLFGINSLDEVVGGCGTTGLAFEFDYATNQYTTITVPGSVDTFVLGINDNNQLVGFYDTVPEPTPFALLGIGLTGLVFGRIRRRIDLRVQERKIESAPGRVAIGSTFRTRTP